MNDFTDLNEMKLNDQQESVFKALVDFISCDEKHEAFILNGYAGTGKTSLLKELAKYLELIYYNFYLLAPTGRAAKVLSKKTGKNAQTIHSFIYTLREIENGEVVKMEFVPRGIPLQTKSVIIIDEASMVSDLPVNNELFFSKNSVLHDLIVYFKSCPSGTKLIFVGDRFQLPPVNEDSSNSLDSIILADKFQISTISFELTEVVRQKSDSYIFQNAYLIRNLMSQKRNYFPLLKYKNMYRIDLAICNYCKLFDPYDSSKTIFIGWKNSAISKINRMIRNRIHNNPVDILSKEEQIILCRTAYKQYCIPSAEIGKIIDFDPNTIEIIADIKFAEAIFQFEILSGEVIEFKSKFDVDYLLSDNNSDSPERIKKLWADRKRKNKIFRESNNPNHDPYLSALKIKYGYAITAHKAQGGEWDHVFLYPEFPSDHNRMKWIYTSITRAKEDLYSY